MIDENKLNGESCNLRLGNFHWRTDLNTRVCRELVITRKSQYFLHSSPFAIFEGFDWMRKSSDGRCTQVDSRTIYVHSFSINAYMAGPCIFYFKHDAVIVADLYDFDHLRALWIPPVADSFGWQPITSPSAAGRQLIVSPKSEWRGMHGSYLCSPFAHIMKYSYKDV